MGCGYSANIQNFRLWRKNTLLRIQMWQTPLCQPRVCHDFGPRRLKVRQTKSGAKPTEGENGATEKGSTRLPFSRGPWGT